MQRHRRRKSLLLHDKIDLRPLFWYTYVGIFEKGGENKFVETNA